MEKFMNWMSDVVAPKMENLTNNAWLSAMQKAIIKTLPMVLVGSLITVYNVIRNFIPSLPVLSSISSYTFGLISLFMVFLIPYYVLELKKNNKMKIIAGFTGIALFMILVNPEITDAGYIYQFSAFGAGGMFVAIVAGLFTAFIMNLYQKFTFFKEDSVMPDFVKEWFDSMLPIATVVLIGWLLVIQLGFDMYTAIVNFFSPLNAIAQSPVGMILLYLIPTILYSMGISGWVFQPIINPIVLVAITANAEAVASGLAATQPFTNEATYAWLSLGGRGATLPLSIMLLFAASKRLKALGKAAIVPSVLNINEPIVFGCVAWNPILMIPMWITAIVLPLITYLAQVTGLVVIPTEVFNMWYCPVFISSWLVNHSVSGLVLTAINLAVAALIYFPFFKAYDKQQLKLEMAENE
ncbi:PTS cellobiose transporter subunit IIC [Lachnoclostridium sp. An131]|jgi:PTS system cellobiose-specific IIC component|uniref:PTS sugar transporter subunit IIC n=1 Tax=Lachnoclostridium sp. An131 TaxID=1965555 RepID=UPI000B38497F|nr:PTS transporter subunit EIIC [Lachnoclostridium sp. An131]OUQ25326.1 PTS cellobiose transporter subunit IIC [Lachnoclostridium sp. An131]